MAKTNENIEHYLDPENHSDYLHDLCIPIKEAYLKKEAVTIKIIKALEKGFSVKVGGLFAFVHYDHFCWQYPKKDHWEAVSKHLIHTYFKAKIYSLTENPIRIVIDAKAQDYKKPHLIANGTYRGVVLMKATYGVFIDLGVHFNWKFGSLVGLIYKSTLAHKTDLDAWTVGDKITTVFRKYNENGQLILGDNRKRGKWLTPEIEKLITTVQKVSVVITEEGKKEFYVLGKHKAILPYTKEFYPKFKKAIHKHFHQLEHGEIIDCEVVRLKNSKDCFILKLVLDPETGIIHRKDLTFHSMLKDLQKERKK